MKRLIAFFTILLSIYPFGITAAQTFEDRIHAELAAGTGTKSKGMQSVDLSVKAGIDIIPHLYAFANVESNYSLYDRNDVRTWYKGQSIGGGLGAQLWTKKQSTDALDLRVKVLTSIGGSDWKRTTYDVSLAWYLQSPKRRVFTPVVEIGYRHINSRTMGLDNTNALYASIGLRF